MTMREYAKLETSALLPRLAAQVDHAAVSGDADSIHDLRVVIRRLSRCLRLFAQFYPGHSWRKLREELGHIMDAAGAVRDLDIAIALLAEAGIPRRASSVVRLSAVRRKRSSVFLAAVRRWSGHRLARGWRRKLESQPMAKTLKAVWNERAGPEVNARRELPRLTTVFFADVRAALAVRPSPDQLHRVRLAAKRMRYTLELFRRCYGRGLESRIESLRKLQQVLGEINDCAATRRVLAGSVPVSPQRSTVERLLASRLRKKTGELRTLWKAELGAPGQELRWARYLTRNAHPPRPAKPPEFHGAKTEKAAGQHR